MEFLTGTQERLAADFGDTSVVMRCRLFQGQKLRTSRRCHFIFKIKIKVRLVDKARLKCAVLIVLIILSACPSCRECIYKSSLQEDVYNLHPAMRVQPTKVIRFETVFLKLAYSLCTMVPSTQ